MKVSEKSSGGKNILLLIAVAIVFFVIGYILRDTIIGGPPQEDALPDSTASAEDDLNSGRFFRIYDLDAYTWKEEVSLFIRPPENLSLGKKLEFLAYYISYFKFGMNPIEILSIDESDGKRIAVINLKEPDEKGRRTWKGIYFQGSTGGGITQHILEYSFLQRDYEGEWIDGIEFYYEGKPIEEWDHINLTGTILREGQ